MLKALKIIIITIVTLSTLSLVVLFGLGYYLENHKSELFNKIEKFYSEKFNGVLTFEDVSISTFKNLPNVTLGLKNLSISDTIYSKDKTETLTIESLQLSVSLQKVLEKEIQIKSIKILNGGLKLFTDSLGNNNHSIFTPKKDSVTKTKSKEKNWFSENGLKLYLEDFDVSIIDYQKNKRITGFVNNISSKLQFEDSTVVVSTDLEVQMKEMGLNLDNGTFFNDVLVSGELEATYLKNEQLIKIPNFDLTIGEQIFNVNATISTEVPASFDFTLKNPSTIIEPTKALLSQNIQRTLKKYKVENPIYVDANLKGKFEHGDNPVVKIYGATKNNIIYLDNEPVKDLTFEANFVNRAYPNDLTLNEDKKNIQLDFDKLEGVFQNLPFNFKKAILRSYPEARNFIDINMHLHAEATVLNDFFKSDQFLFTEGTFDFNTIFKGDATIIENVYNNTLTNLSFSKTAIKYKPHELEIPIDSISLKVNKKDAYLSEFSIPLKETNNKIHFSGKLMNAPALIFGGKGEITSELDVYSDALIWEDFLYLFKQKSKSKTEKQEDIYFNEALKAIYKKFNPQLKISIKKFQYQNLIVNDLSSGFFFKEINAVDLDKTGFNYRDGAIGMQLEFDISDPNITSFNLDLIADNIDLGSLLKEFDYFGLSSLKDAKKIDGIISFETIMAGEVHESNGLDTKSLKGTVSLDLKEVEINGFEPIIKVANKVFKKERFEDIRFAPIKETIYVSNRTIEIPQTEIQTTAFDLFVEGHLNYDFKTNIWVSVPISNIKKRDLNNIPEKRGYAESGKKVFVQVIDDGKGNLDYKFHLNNKKLYEEKGTLSQYKTSHKEERQTKRDYKKQARKDKRDAKKKNN